MNMSQTLTRIAAFLCIAMPSLCYAGRPVIGALSISNLVDRSSVIAAVTMAEPAGTSADKHDCQVITWHLTVTSVLKNSAATHIAPGGSIDVLANVIAVTDCTIRSLPGMSSGASFAAERYKPSITAPPKRGRFLVFLVPGDTGYRLAASSAFEAISKKTKVVTLIAGQRHQAQQIAPADRHPATRAAGG